MPQRVFAALLLLILGLLPLAGSARLVPALDTSSPYATMRSFDQEMQRIAALYQAYRAQPSARAQRALGAAASRAANQLLDMSHVPPATHQRLGLRTLLELADIMLRLPEIAPETIPGAPGQTGRPVPIRWTLPDTEIRIERISQGDTPPDFRFSSSTVARIGEFHFAIIDQPPLRPAPLTHWRQAQIDMTGPLVPMRLVENLPLWLRRSVGEAPIWKILATLVVTILAFAVMITWGRLIRRLARHATPLRRTARWLTVPLVIALTASLAHHLIDRQINLTGVFDLEALVTTLLLYIAGAWAMALIFRFLAEAIIASPRVPDDGYDAHLLRLLARVTGFIGAVAVLVYGANDLGLPALGVAAGLGVGSVALALASQSTVENLFGGVSIFADRPFRVGDLIRFNDLKGIVESIGPRSTRIRAPDGTLTTVPNADIARAHVNNLSVRNSFLFEHRVNLPPGATAAQITALLAMFRKLLEDHPAIAKSDGPPHVRLTSLAPDSGGIHLFAHVIAKDEEAFLQTQEALLLCIMKLLSDDAITGTS
ncbi:MAG: mechanosensitive ion channel [Roseomonas sp.]|nr:mechanosensitive ion channel [Roseomonas sp.]MCA3317325.1 mechanosensitive ion channel [Roseomonas sp.]MCA3319172.1 mechanosensitive ion channel [Roseomonas sp.]